MDDKALILTIKIYDEKTKLKVFKMRKKMINLTELFINFINSICM